MFGISAFEIILFLKQAGFGLAGAACLWGLYFYIKAKHAKGKKEQSFTKVAQKMIEPLSIGTLLVVLGWGAFEVFYPPIVTAHEGISIVPTIEGVRESFLIIKPLFFLFIAIYLVSVLIKKTNKKLFMSSMPAIYGTEFILAFVLISFPAWTGGINSLQAFFAGHGFHSIFTLGTVLILDFLFILTKYSEGLEEHIYPTLPTVSKVIWTGLALDFVSVAFIFHDAVAFTPKFIFMQTVIAIIIINGIFLSGPITEKLLQYTKKGGMESMHGFWGNAATASGAISITSWLTVTFVDGLRDISLSYPALLGLYVTAIVAAYLAYEMLEHYKIGSRW